MSETPTTMAREMNQQPEAVERTLAALLPRRDELSRLFEGRREVLFVARGSSSNAAIYGRYLLETHAGVRGGLLAPSVATHYRRELDLSDLLVVGVSQSGRTEEIVETLYWSGRCGAATVAVSNDAASPLASAADLALTTVAGHERAVPATKSYVAQMVAMAVLGTALAPEQTALDDDLSRLAGQADHLLRARSGVDDAVTALHQASGTVVSGRGLMLGTALETALKLEETCLRPVRGYSYADLRHGPISVVTQGIVAILVAAQDGPLLTPMVELASDLRRRGAATIGIGGGASLASAVDLPVAGPDLPEALAPVATIVSSQLIVEQLSRTLGLDPDNPRGLAKVTATDPIDQE